jgi:hypothetical protein
MKTIRIKIALALLLALTGVARAEFTFDAEVPLEPRVEEAIARAQAGLAQKQLANGSWGNCNGRNGLACMAMMVNGNSPGHGKQGAKIAQGIDFIINSQHANGYLVVGNTGNMYQHALSTLALVEAYGMTHNPAIREAVIKAVDLIVGAQNQTGGWRYSPTSQDADLSVTVMQTMALRAATETGIYVPKESIDFAIAFVRRMFNDKNATFGYTSPDEGNFNRAGAGVVCLQSCGYTDDPRIPRTVKYMIENAKYDSGGSSSSDPWYGYYYCGIAMYHYGGEAWKTFYPRICEKVLKDWEKNPSYGDVLDTSWAILVIGTPYRYLPIYQR